MSAVEAPRHCGRDGHDDRPAVAALIFDEHPLSYDGMCADCARCRDCASRASVLDAEYNEAYCTAHAETYPADEAPHGPRIVDIDSTAWAELAAAD